MKKALKGVIAIVALEDGEDEVDDSEDGDQAGSKSPAIIEEHEVFQVPPSDAVVDHEAVTTFERPYWSNSSTQLSQTEQCEARGGRSIEQV